MPELDIPQAVRAKATVHGAQQWLAALPALVADLAGEWSLRVGRVYQDATEALVAEAELADGTQAVLKLIVPRAESARQEIAALRLADGQGCARLLRADEERGALLLERLGPSLYDLNLPLPRQHEILCAAASLLWRPAPGLDLPSGADKGRWLIDFVTATWEELGQPCSDRTVAHALACARRRVGAHDDRRAVLCHGDVHAWNALDAGDGTFKLVDPDGLVAEPEYDLGIIMREDPEDLLHSDPYERSTRLAQLTGRDALGIWEWGVVERVSTGLLLTSIDVQPVGRQMLAAADRIAAMAG